MAATTGGASRRGVGWRSCAPAVAGGAPRRGAGQALLVTGARAARNDVHEEGQGEQLAHRVLRRSRQTVTPSPNFGFTVIESRMVARDASSPLLCPRSNH